MTVSPITFEGNRPISSGQRKTMRSFMYGTVDKAAAELGLTRRSYQNLLGHPALQAKMTELVRECSGIDPRYEFLADLGEILVPDGYDHDTYLDRFIAENGRAFHDLDDGLNSENFAKATVKLAAGRRLNVECWHIKTRVTSEDNLRFLVAQGSVLAGANGAALVFEQKRNLLPKNCWHVSFDEKDALWKGSSSRHQVPILGNMPIGGLYFIFAFKCCCFEDSSWDHDCSLLVFRDVSPDDA